MKHLSSLYISLFVITLVYVACTKRSGYDVASKERLFTQSQYAINLSLGKNFGVIGHMHLESVADTSGIKVYGWIEKNLNNSRSDSLGEDAEQVREYQLTNNFTLNDSSDAYNGFTLPLFLQHLATQRIGHITKINTLLIEIENEEQRLLAIAESLYKDFTKLNIAKHKHYLLSGLAEQRDIKFAGKSLSKSLAAVRKEITKRHSDLTIIEYDTKKLLKAHSNYGTNTPALAYDIFSRAAALQLRHEGGQAAPILPKFNVRNPDISTRRGYFENVVTQLVVLWQAKLQLATDLCAIYEPFQTNYYFSMGGVQEHLRITITTIDDGNNSFIRYMVRARGQNNKEFDFGYTEHDRSGKAVSMRLNLKPLGGAKRFSRLDLTLE